MPCLQFKANKPRASTLTHVVAQYIVSKLWTTHVALATQSRTHGHIRVVSHTQSYKPQSYTSSDAHVVAPRILGKAPRVSTHMKHTSQLRHTNKHVFTDQHRHNTECQGLSAVDPRQSRRHIARCVLRVQKSTKGWKGVCVCVCVCVDRPTWMPFELHMHMLTRVCMCMYMCISHPCITNACMQNIHTPDARTRVYEGACMEVHTHTPSRTLNTNTYAHVHTSTLVHEQGLSQIHFHVTLQG